MKHLKRNAAITGAAAILAALGIGGVTYLVSGGAATLRPTGRENFTEVSTSTLHYVDLLAEDDRLTLRAIDQSGTLLDSVELTR